MVTTKRRRSAGHRNVAIAYVRTSTEDQRLGPDAQRATIEDWARREDVQIVAWCVDRGVSGATPIDERPAFLDALAGLRTHRAGQLLVAKRDRLARDPVVAAMADRVVEKLGARVVSVDGAGNGDGPADAFMRTVIDAASAYERALIRTRTRAALAMKRTRGERISRHAPYGHRFDGERLVEDPAEQKTVAKARALRAKGLTLRAIVEELEHLGHVNRAGKPFAVSNLHAMLRA